MNAVIYSRVSTEDQDNERQIRELKEYAKYKKVKVLKIFQEKISGAIKTQERNEFKKLLEFVDEKNVHHVLIWELSRLGRSMKNVSDTIEFLSEKKINIYSHKENFNTLNQQGKKDIITNILIMVLTGFAEMERETIKVRSSSGIRNNVAGGGSGTGVIKAYGFKKVAKKLVIDEDESEVIKLIFRKYMSGLGTLSIANFLNDNKIPTRYNKLFSGKKIQLKDNEKDGSKFKWVDGTVYSILKNPIYKGERLHKGEVFKVPAIIDTKVFDDVQARLKANYNKKGFTRKYENPLKDILKCGVCGRSYFLHKRQSGKDNAYKCLSKRYKEYCGNHSIGYDKLNDALYRLAGAYIATNALQQSGVKERIENRIENDTTIRQSTSNQIVAINNKLDRLFNLFVEGDIVKKKYHEKKIEYEAELMRLNDRLTVIDSELQKLHSIIEDKRDVQSYDRKVYNTQLRSAFESIIIYPTKTDPTIFKYKNDKCVIVDMITTLEWLDGIPAGGTFILSQHSNTVAFPKFRSEKALLEGKYTIQAKYELSDLRITAVPAGKGLVEKKSKKKGKIR